jgi:hypothetical protein
LCTVAAAGTRKLNCIHPYIHIFAMREIDLHYPEEKCPFCTIAAAYPVKEGGLWKKEEDLESAVPDGEVDYERTTPGSFVVLSSPEVLAFLDILPMVGGMYFLFMECNERF